MGIKPSSAATDKADAAMTTPNAPRTESDKNAAAATSKRPNNFARSGWARQRPAPSSPRLFSKSSEPLVNLPSHRILALFRGEKEEMLALELVPDPAVLDRGEPGIFVRRSRTHFKITD